MSNITLTINQRSVVGQSGQSILQAAQANGIDIPFLCYNERVVASGACGICVVELENAPKLVRACSTQIVEGMTVHTNTPRVRNHRKATLELLLSDHTGDCRAPCMRACPAQTDCQGYVGLIANGAYDEALRLIKEKIPLPNSIGRVCPHPCEDACRRTLVEQPISIAALKAFAAQHGGEHMPAVAPATGKRVAIIGGGPGGLAAAYFLAQQGHAVTVYDAMPHMGGMLYYGIPAYRLPRETLQAEVDAIAGMGVAMQNNVKVGTDVSLQQLRAQYDAVVVAVGAWRSTKLRCPDETLDGVVGGIEFLRAVALGKQSQCSGVVAVVGGGNTAMDACRTALRLGAERVYNIYRRTKAEMPAEAIEIIEAEEEGVVFKALCNPVEILGKDGRVAAVRLQAMELGEPDASGRRSPVAIEGQEELLEINTLIVAIGQAVALDGFEALALNRRGNIAADEYTFMTSERGVFAVGDAINYGADIAITAIAQAHKAADAIGQFLRGEAFTHTDEFLVQSEQTEQDFAEVAKAPRAIMPHRAPEQRMHDFVEINLGFSEEAAKAEAMRCLECGCQGYYNCKLLALANEYDATLERYAGKANRHPKKDESGYIRRDPQKCILCGLCVQVCDQIPERSAIGFLGRGFDTLVQPAFGQSLREAGCVACGQCVAACPTGALVGQQLAAKQVPLRETVGEATVCPHCAIGCKRKVAKKGSLSLRYLPAEENGLLCRKGLFDSTAPFTEAEMPLLKKIAQENGFTGELPILQ